MTVDRKKYLALIQQIENIKKTNLEILEEHPDFAKKMSPMLENLIQMAAKMGNISLEDERRFNEHFFVIGGSIGTIMGTCIKESLLDTHKEEPTATFVMCTKTEFDNHNESDGENLPYDWTLRTRYSYEELVSIFGTQL